MIAKIAVSAAAFAIDKPYSYRVPPQMQLQPGAQVSVPFGRANRRCEGVVLALEQGDAEGLKAIEACLDVPVLDENLLRMAAFVRERSFCTFYEAVRAILPAGAWMHASDSYSLSGDMLWKEKPPRKDGACLILQLLESQGGRADMTALRRAIPDEDALRGVLQYLVRKKWVVAHTDFLRRTGDKTEQIATLAASAEEVMEYAAHRPKAAMQRAVLELLCSVGSAPVKEICYFTGAQAATVRRLEKLGYLTLSQRPVLRCREIRPATVNRDFALNAQQAHAFAGLVGQMHQEVPGAALLYGVTGSGKTSVYLKLIRTCLEEGRSALLLVPEIALTPQLLGVMAGHFGDLVAVLHSSLPAAERYDQWKRIRCGDARVVVGTRSAVFAPCRDLGLIILDEEQEHSYMSENVPRYSAREVALWRGSRERALVLLGSATPSIETMYRARSGEYGLYRLETRYNSRPLPQVQIVDMQQELRSGNDLTLSRPLIQAIRQTADAGKQTILLLNRRGNRRALVCVDCGKAPQCPRCSANLTYHSANARLMCHYCGYSVPAPQRCPDCGGPLKGIGTGTQKVQQELETLFPDLEIERMDTDTVNAVNTHEKILEHFQSAHVPVLIGTQMVAKGLNLPDVTLVGVLEADLGLYCGGFRAAESTFAMLTQAVGRAGRGESPGRALIQTMLPEHRVITLAAGQDYDGFYDLEIRLRQMQFNPPFADAVLITFTGQEEARVLRGAAKFRDGLQSWLTQQGAAQPHAELLGPAPCPVPKVNYHFRYRLTLRCRMNRAARQALAYLLRQFAQDGANRGVSAFADANGFD